MDAPDFESPFELLSNDMRSEIFNKILETQDWKTAVRMLSVCKTWRRDVEIIWRGYCEKNRLLEDEAAFKVLNRDWKWICACRTVRTHWL